MTKKLLIVAALAVMAGCATSSPTQEQFDALQARVDAAEARVLVIEKLEAIEARLPAKKTPRKTTKKA